MRRKATDRKFGPRNNPVKPRCGDLSLEPNVLKNCSSVRSDLFTGVFYGTQASAMKNKRNQEPQKDGELCHAGKHWWLG